MSPDSEGILPVPPPISEPSASRSGSRLRGGFIGMIALCIIAIVSQAAGLRSLVQYGSEREGWNAQKEQFATVQTEWSQLSKQFSTDIGELKKQKELLTAELIKLEDDRKRLVEDLVKVKGQYESLSQSRDDAIALQRRSQQQQQEALDTEQAAKSRTAELTKEQGTLTKDISQLAMQRDILQKAVDTNQATLDKQVATLMKQTQDLDDLDMRVSLARATLRKQNEDSLKASDDLAKLLAGKQAALTAATNAADEKDRVEKLNAAFTSLSGKVEALKVERDGLLVELSKEETRLQNAKAKLADYLEQWNNRETITKELVAIKSEVALLNSEKKVSAERIAELKTMQEALGELVAEKSKELSGLRLKVDNLRLEDASLSASLEKKLKEMKMQTPKAETTAE